MTTEGCVIIENINEIYEIYENYTPPHTLSASMHSKELLFDAYKMNSICYDLISLFLLISILIALLHKTVGRRLLKLSIN